MFGVVYTPWSIGRCMAKGSTDLILRDRLQFTLDATGNQTTVYGRFDLSDYVNALERKGLSIKEVNFMLRDNTNGNTGNFSFSQALGHNHKAQQSQTQLSCMPTTLFILFRTFTLQVSPLLLIC